MMKGLYDIVKERIKNVLKNIPGNHTAEKLAVMCGIFTEDDWHRTIRRIVEELTQEGYPIGSDTRGFAWIRTDAELQYYLNGLQRRQVALCKRIANIYDGYQDHKKKSLQ